MSFRISNLFRIRSPSGPIGRRPQRWAKAACWIAFASAVPSTLWRLAMLAGFDTGFAEAERFRSSTPATLYVLTLEAVQITAATLCLGLCYRWGEKVPRWVPSLGGKTIHRSVPTAVAGAGALCLYVIVGTITVQIVGVSAGAWKGWTPLEGMDSGQRTLLIAAYAPAIAWPFALTAATIGYWRRRSWIGPAGGTD